MGSSEDATFADGRQIDARTNDKARNEHPMLVKFWAAIACLSLLAGTAQLGAAAWRIITSPDRRAHITLLVMCGLVTAALIGALRASARSLAASQAKPKEQSLDRTRDAATLVDGASQ